MIKYLYENKKIFSECLEKLDNWKLGNIRSVLNGSNQVFLLELFDPSYVNSAYVKKHYRCLSRLRELLVGSEARADAATE